MTQAPIAYRTPRPQGTCTRCGYAEWVYDERLMHEWRCENCHAYRYPDHPCQRCGCAEWVYEAKTHHWYCKQIQRHQLRGENRWEERKLTILPIP